MISKSLSALGAVLMTLTVFSATVAVMNLDPAGSNPVSNLA
jgi:hypothetical protein